MNILVNTKISFRNKVQPKTHTILYKIALMGLLFCSCGTEDDGLPRAPMPDDKELITDIALPGLQINRLDFDGGWIYFIATDAMYRLDMAQDDPNPEFIHEDPDGPMDLAVIDGKLYYTPFWVMTELRAIDLETKNMVPSGIDLPFFKAALAKRGNELIYLETESSFGFDTKVHSRDMVTGGPDRLLHELPFEELEHMVHYKGALYFFRTFYTGDNKGSWLLRTELGNMENRPEVLFQITSGKDIISAGTGLAVNDSGIYFTHLLGEGLYHMEHGAKNGQLILPTEAVTPNTTDALGPLLTMGNHLYMGSKDHLFQLDLKLLEHSNGTIAVSRQTEP
ncbi:hypothetical protein J4E06_06955 [Muricauda sp. NFXS6]|uniref:hypothetical protein n=1 Tax=Allomuricauda sp. NFXS6 TaxID=2819094 RepID=UPI0032DEB5F2